MECIFWFSLIYILVAYVGYPLWTLLLSLFVNQPVAQGDIEPTVSFIIAAYNEEKDIERKLHNTFAIDYPKEKLEIIVASDGSTDGTDEIVRKYEKNAMGCSVRLHRVEGRAGKTAAQNSAVKKATGEILIFSDCASMYDKYAVRALARNYADPAVGAVSGMYRYVNKTGSGVGLATILFWKYENFIKERQNRLRTVTGCSGCIYSVRREAYTELPPEIISDLVEPLTVLKKGYRIAYDPAAVAYEDTTESPGQEFRMRIRVIVRGMNGLLYMRALLNPIRFPYVASQLLLHKVVRWGVPVFAIVLFVSSATLLGADPLYQLAFYSQAIFYGMAVAGALLDRLGKKPRILSLPMYFMLVNAASLISLYKVFRGENIVIWQTQR